MYHYFYRITNGVNGKVYYGVHSTDNLDDGYMGSGKLILRAIKKYGKENFTKDILKFFESREKLSEYEKQFVNESLVNDESCYNLITGGLESQGLIEYSRTHLMVCDPNDEHHRIFSVKRDDPRILTGELVKAATILYKGKITVRDKNGKCFMVNKDDPRYLSGDLKFVMDGCNKGKITVRDKNGNCFMVNKDDPRYLSGELVLNSKGKCLGMILCRDKDGNYFRVNKDDPRYLSGELIAATKGLTPVHDKFGNTLLVPKTDPRLKTGEVKHNTVGFISVKDNDGNTFQVSKDDPRYLSGELVGVSKGKVVVKDKDGNTFQVSKDDPRYLSGELKSNRCGYKWINKDGKLKSVSEECLEQFINDGWKIGVGNARKYKNSNTK